MARMMPTSRDYVLSKYKLHKLREIEDFVADCVEVPHPQPASASACLASCQANGVLDQRAIQQPNYRYAICFSAIALPFY